MPPSLHVEWGDGSATFPSPEPVTIGRHADCEVRIHDMRVSRRHASLQFEAGHWVLTDLESTQGTFLDGRRVHSEIVDHDMTIALGAQSEAPTLWLHLERADDDVASDDVPLDDVASDDVALDDVALDDVPLDDVPLDDVALDEPEPSDVTTTLGSRSNIQVLRLLCDGTERKVPLHAPASIGRDPQCTLSIANSLVSRVHARIEPTETGWDIVDAASRSGLFWDDTRIERQPLSGLMRFWLGPPDAGGRLVVVAPGPNIVSPTERRRHTRARWMLVAAAASVLAVVLGAGALVATRGQGHASTTPNLDRLKLATVRLVDDQQTESGSGTIITRDGVILTNAHVAKPSAIDPSASDPDYLTVYITQQPDEPAQPRYRARVVEAGSEWRDLAVLRIYAHADGTPVERSGLALPTVPLGDASTVRTGGGVWVLGFPGISGLAQHTLSDAAVTVTAGDISNVERGRQLREESTKVAESQDAELPSDYVAASLDDAPVIFSTTAAIAEGNSGGVAVDADGRLVGVPTWSVLEVDSDGKPLGATSGKLLSVNVAKPLIASAIGDTGP